jgi:hypothetical protein
MKSNPLYPGDPGNTGFAPQVSIDPQLAAPDIAAYVSASDLLLVQVNNAAPNMAVLITARLLMPDGSLKLNSWTFTPTSDRVNSTVRLPIVECFILSLFVSLTLAGPGNRTFARVRLVTGSGGNSTVTQTLTQGYLAQSLTLTFPPGIHESGSEGAGAIVSIKGTTPGAGAEITETVPAGAMWQLKTFNFQLTTGVAVANRIPHLIIDDGANILLNSAALTPQAASLAGIYNSGDDALALPATDSVQWLQLVAGLRLMAGYRIRTLTTGLQAADQYTAPQYLVTEWLFN